MLSSLYIENIAVIEKASIDFESGFTCLTGETGAGKSIIIDAIQAVMGDRVSKDLIRTGTDSASVSAMFTDLKPTVIEKLDELGVPHDEDELQLVRTIRQGRNTQKANGMPITAAMLKEIGNTLININGQHESYELLTPEIHGRYIDTYGNLGELISEYQSEYTRLREIQRELESLKMDENQKARRIDLLRYQIDEIRAADVKPGEREELKKRADQISHGEQISNDVREAKELLNGDTDFEGAITFVHRAAELAESAARSHLPLTATAEELRNAEYLLQDAEAELRSFEDSFDFDPAELADIEDRLDLLYRLSLKYGETEQDILKFLDESQKELDTIELADEKMEILATEFEEVKAKAIALAKKLSEKRKECSVKFSQEVKNQLKFLNMPSVEFAVRQDRVPLNKFGCDSMEFMVSANSGESLKPMSKIASGGELSRIMLAIKTVLSKGDNIDTLIFDEIDTGISGEAGRKVGLKLREAAGNRQVICITHLAQIAAMAENQMLIVKHDNGARTYTEVKLLDHDARLKELARIIGGDDITPLKLKMAEEMLSLN
ncbi:MAG: DNA repair protein RecN [Clostridia bacterium]|nr:DNA repair protein RecN [Clostridia bacterium]